MHVKTKIKNLIICCYPVFVIAMLLIAPFAIVYGLYNALRYKEYISIKRDNILKDILLKDSQWRQI